jgi:hypothetical protein
MLFREIIAVYCENSTEHINAMCLQSTEFLMLQQTVYNYHFALNVYYS